jgi:serine/threonine protein kinase
MTSGTDPLIGTTLGSYKVIEAVGQGGMARIYKGLHTELNRYAAIKVVNWGLQEDPTFTERFRREAQAIASLRHPNIVQIHDFGKYTSGYYMVMEFIDGSDLAVQLRQQRTAQTMLPKEQVIRIVKDVAAALDYAHKQGVVHRDVKPSNIMINRQGQSILTDFGLVMLSNRQSQVTLGSTFGTPHYVAPEQAISSAAAVPASDIYSLGVILYEMVTGQTPFDDDSPLSVALKHVSEHPPAPTLINPDLPRSVEKIILKAMSKQSVDRFESAGELATGLEVAWTGAYESKTDQLPPAPVLPPVGVPSVSEVPKMTLPNAAAIAPPLATAAESHEKKEAAHDRKKPVLPGWWPLALAGVIGIVLGGILFFAVGKSSNGSSATPTMTSDELAAAFNPPVSIATTSTPTPTTTPTATSTVTPVPPTVTPTATSSPTPTPTSTATPTPTFTPEPTATPTASPTPLPLPTPTPKGPLTVSQLKGKILFKTSRSGAVEIYRMDPDGSNQLPLSPENWSIYTELESLLPFSSDQTEQIVIRGEGQLDLWRANLVTGQELRITSSDKADYDAAWSPVNNWVAYVSEQTGRGDIYMLNLDGSAVIRLTDNLDDFDKHPTWSPDGAKIAFWSDRGFNKTRQIWVIDLESRVESSLSDNPFNDWDPVWVR